MPTSDIKPLSRLIFILSLRCIWEVEANQDYLPTVDLSNNTFTKNASRLYDDILVKSGYNKAVRPRPSPDSAVTMVRLGLSLAQINDVDEKNQILTTNVWLDQEWVDYKLTWNPENYGNIRELYVPAEQLWIPDIVLYNTAEGDFTIQYTKTVATIRHDGTIRWRPPATYKSYCEIKVAFFPFDVQECFMKFGSWTYNNENVDLRHRLEPDKNVEIPNGTDLTDYAGSTEWDILNVTAMWYEKPYPCCNEAFTDIKFYFTLRRKVLFYTINLVIPCVAICILTMFVFYLPAACQEKITLCITILNCLTFFLMLVYEINPPTSFATPLIGKYILFTMVLLTLSIMMTVFVLNIHFRSPSTHEMSPLVRRMFLHVLPGLLLMRPPHSRPKSAEDALGLRLRAYFRDNRHFSLVEDNIYDGTPTFGGTIAVRRRSRFKPGTQQAMLGMSYVAEHLRQEDQNHQVTEEWHYVARVVDRLFLWFYIAVCLCGTMGMFVHAAVYRLREGGPVLA